MFINTVKNCILSQPNLILPVKNISPIWPEPIVNWYPITYLFHLLHGVKASKSKIWNHTSASKPKGFLTITFFKYDRSRDSQRSTSRCSLNGSRLKRTIPRKQKKIINLRYFMNGLFLTEFVSNKKTVNWLQLLSELHKNILEIDL